MLIWIKQNLILQKYTIRKMTHFYGLYAEQYYFDPLRKQNSYARRFQKKKKQNSYWIVV